MCKHDNWVLIGWPIYIESTNTYRVTSIYDVFCNECKKYINLLSGKEIDPDGRTPLRS